MMNCVAVKGKCIIIPFTLQKQILDQLHSNHMWIEKMWLLVMDSLYWINMYADVEHIVRQCTMCLEYEQTQSQEKALHYKIPYRPWQVIGADLFRING